MGLCRSDLQRVALNDAVADGPIPTNPGAAIRLRPARPARVLVWTRPARLPLSGRRPGPPAR